MSNIPPTESSCEDDKTFSSWCPPPDAVLKLHVGHGVRRVPAWRIFKYNGSKDCYERLVSNSVKFYKEGDSENKEDYEVNFTYTDEDGDVITISSDFELVDAWQQFLPDGKPISGKKLNVRAVLKETTKEKKVAEVKIVDLAKPSDAPAAPKSPLIAVCPRRTTKRLNSLPDQARHPSVMTPLLRRNSAAGSTALLNFQSLLESFVAILAKAVVALQGHLDWEPKQIAANLSPKPTASPRAVASPRATASPKAAASPKDAASPILRTTHKVSNVSEVAETIQIESDAAKEVAEKLMKDVMQHIETKKKARDEDSEDHRNNLNTDFIHARHTCDGCLKAPIVGLRYHATNLKDYDICVDCFQNFKGEDIVFEATECEHDRCRQNNWKKRFSKGIPIRRGGRRFNRKCKGQCPGKIGSPTEEINKAIGRSQPEKKMAEVVDNKVASDMQISLSAENCFVESVDLIDVESLVTKKCELEEINEAIRRSLSEEKSEEEIEEVKVPNDDESIEIIDATCRVLSQPVEAESKIVEMNDVEFASPSTSPVTAVNVPSADIKMHTSVAKTEDFLTYTLDRCVEAIGTVLNEIDQAVAKPNAAEEKDKKSTPVSLKLEEKESNKEETNIVDVSNIFAGETISAMTTSFVSEKSLVVEHESKLEEEVEASSVASSDTFVSVHGSGHGLSDENNGIKDACDTTENQDKEKDDKDTEAEITATETGMNTKEPEEVNVEPESKIGATILESIEASGPFPDDKSIMSANSDDWDIVDNQINSDEMLARAAQVIGSALFNSDMTKSACVASVQSVNTEASSADSVVSVSTASSSSVVSSVPSIGSSVSLPTISSTISCPLIVHWGKHVQQLREIGFVDNQKSLSVLETLQAANIGVDSSDAVSVTDAVNYLLRNP